ncbi:MAG TPA: hypothetical protein VGM30_01295 [Puia sp.]
MRMPCHAEEGTAGGFAGEDFSQGRRWETDENGAGRRGGDGRRMRTGAGRKRGAWEDMGDGEAAPGGRTGETERPRRGKAG